MKIEKLQPGMTVYDVHKHKAGNTTLTTWGTWSVRIVSVDVERGAVVARWNGNKERTYYRNEWSKWREKPPVMVNGIFGTKRPANRAELAAMKAAAAQGESK